MNTSLETTILNESTIRRMLLYGGAAFSADNCLLMTGTMKQKRSYPMEQHLDEHFAPKNVRDFHNKLNRRVYGPATKRGKAVEGISIIARNGTNQRWHHHAIIKIPDDWRVLQPKTALAEAIKDCWRRTPYAWNRVHLQPVDENREYRKSRQNPPSKGVEGWLEYMCHQTMEVPCVQPKALARLLLPASEVAA